MFFMSACLGSFAEYFRPAALQKKKKPENRTFEVLNVESKFSVDSLSANRYRRGGLMVFVSHHEVDEAMNFPEEDGPKHMDPADFVKANTDGGVTEIQNKKPIESSCMRNREAREFQEANQKTVHWLSSIRTCSNVTVNDIGLHASLETISALDNDDDNFTDSGIGSSSHANFDTVEAIAAPNLVYDGHFRIPYGESCDFPSPPIRGNRHAHDWTEVCGPEFTLPKIHRPVQPFSSSTHARRKAVELEQAIFEMNEDLRKSHRQAQCVDRLLPYRAQEKGLGITI